MTDELPDLDPAALDLIDAFKHDTARDASHVDAALRSVTTKLSVPGSGSGSATTAGGLSSTTKVVLATILVGAGVWAVARPATTLSAAAPTLPRVAAAAPEPPLDRGPESSPTVDEPTAPEQLPDVPVAEDSAGDEMPPPARGVTKPTPKRRARPTTAASTLAEELQLLRDARQLLRAGQATDALEVVARHRRAFPASTFAEERDATEITALCRAGRDEHARRKADAFARRFPASTRDVLAGCEGGSP